METMLSALSAPRTALLGVIPLLYLLAAMAPGPLLRDPERGWRLARLCAALAVVASLLSLLWLLVSGPGLTRGPEFLSFSQGVALHLSLRSDALGCLMLLLVSFIGWVIVGYSQSYLGGERGQPRYIRGLMLTLADRKSVV